MSKAKDFTSDTRFRVRVDRGYGWKLRVEFPPVLVTSCLSPKELAEKLEKLTEALSSFSRPMREG